MIIDVFNQFRKTSEAMQAAITASYPDNSLSQDLGIKHLAKIKGMLETLSYTLDCRVDVSSNENNEDDKKEHKVRRIDASWSPSADWEPALEIESEDSQNTPNSAFSVNYIALFKTYIKENKSNIAFFEKTGTGTTHATLQRISGTIVLFIAFLDSIQPIEK